MLIYLKFGLVHKYQRGSDGVLSWPVWLPLIGLQQAAPNLWTWFWLSYRFFTPWLCLSLAFRCNMPSSGFLQWLCLQPHVLWQGFPLLPPACQKSWTLGFLSLWAGGAGWVPPSLFPEGESPLPRAAALTFENPLLVSALATQGPGSEPCCSREGGAPLGQTGDSKDSYWQ